MALQRWPHQVYAVGEVAQLRAKGHRRICVTSPTGGGKSWIMRDLTTAESAKGGRTAILTNRKMLVRQLSVGFVADGVDHGFFAAGQGEELWKRTVICSLQTLVSRWTNDLLADRSLVLVDEAHLSAGKEAHKIIDRLANVGACIVGFTATPIDLGHVYKVLVQAGRNSDLRKCGALIPAVHYGCDEPDLKQLKKKPNEEIADKDNVSAIMRPGVIGRVFQWFNKLNSDRRPTILFAPGVKESIWFAEQFERMGVPSAHIDGEMVWIRGKRYVSNDDSRSEIRSGSQSGTICVVCNRFVLREGVDYPWLGHAIFATVMGSLSTYLQSGGRLLRSYPGTKTVTIQDHGGNWWRHGSLNADRVWRLDYTEGMLKALREDGLRYHQCQQCGENLLRGNQRCSECGFDNTPEPRRCPECGQISVRRACSCGYVHPIGQRSRPVVMADGTLREHVGDIFRPRARVHTATTLSAWTKCYYRALHSNMTFRQAEGLFVAENHYWPHRDLRRMPKRGIDWYRRVCDVPNEDLL